MASANLESDFEKLVTLKEGINLNEVVNGSTVFEVNFDDLMPQEIETRYKPEEVFEYLNPSCCDMFEDEDTYTEGQPFETLAAKMENVTEDGLVKKRVLRKGIGDQIPDLAQVTIDYNAYVEYNDEPFDSTYARKHRFTFRLNQGGVLPGMNAGVGTMRMNEKAQFLVGYQYAYGPHGVLNRIPKEATVLFEIEVRNVVNSGAAVALEEDRTAEEEEHAFDKVYRISQACTAAGTDLYNKNKFRDAIKKYNQAADALERCMMRNMDDEAKQQQLLYKLYSNLLITWVRLNEPRKACINFNKLNKLCIGTSMRVLAKAHFNHAKALVMLNDHRRAKEHFLEARKKEPTNAEISKELKKLEDILFQNAKRNKAMGLALIQSVPNKNEEEFKRYVEEICEELKNDRTSNEYRLPEELPKEHMEMIRRIGVKHRLEVKTLLKGGQAKYFLSKIASF